MAIPYDHGFIGWTPIDSAALLRSIVIAFISLAVFAAFMAVVLRSERRYRIPVPPKLARVAAWAMFLLAPGAAHASPLHSIGPASGGLGALGLLLGLGGLFAFGIAVVPTTAAAATSSAPAATPVYLQPGTWLGLATVLCALLATKFGITIDPAVATTAGIAIAGAILGLFHHTATTDAAAIDHNATVTAAQVTAAASANAGAATAALTQAAK